MFSSNSTSTGSRNMVQYMTLCFREKNHSNLCQGDNGLAVLANEGEDS